MTCRIQLRSSHGVAKVCDGPNHPAIGAGVKISSSTYIHIENFITYYETVL